VLLCLVVPLEASPKAVAGLILVRASNLDFALVESVLERTLLARGLALVESVLKRTLLVRSLALRRNLVAGDDFQTVMELECVPR